MTTAGSIFPRNIRLRFSREKETCSTDMKLPTNAHLKFPLGQTVATPGALEAFRKSSETPLPYLLRHAKGDWGKLCDEDKRLNDDAVGNGTRLLSSYHLRSGEVVWVITESDRSVTTVLLPSEY